MIVGLSLVVALAGFVVFKTPGRAFAYLRGDRLVLDSRSKSFGRLAIGESRTIPFFLWNTSDKPLWIIGSKPSCGCTKMDRLPLEIPSKTEGCLSVVVTPNRVNDRMEETIRLITDDYGEVTLTVRGSTFAQEPTR